MKFTFPYFLVIHIFSWLSDSKDMSFDQNSFYIPDLDAVLTLSSAI